MSWKVYTREVEGKQAQILIDDHYDWTAPVENLVLLSGFSLYCNVLPENTLWHPDETEALDTLEERLLDFCEKYSQGWSLYVMRMTTFGVREYYIYHSEQADLQAAFMAMTKMHPDYRIEFGTVSDPEWKEYRKYLHLPSA